MLSAVVVALAVLGMAGTLITLNAASKRAPHSSENAAKAQSIAEAGISDKLSQMLGGNYASLGTSLRPIAFGGGSYWVAVEDQGEEHQLVRLVSRARCDQETHTIRALVRAFVETPLRDAVFAGNSSGDPTYVLELGGSGERADRIRGDVYCGNDVSLSEGATVDGTVRARGRIRGAAGSTAVSRQMKDLDSVRGGSGGALEIERVFAAAVPLESPIGGTAAELPKGFAAHILRKNPSDRARWTAATPCDDYFLEDPYEMPRAGAAAEPSKATRIALAAGPDARGRSASLPVFLVQGDLWIFNLNTSSFRMVGPNEGRFALTIVVEGNIHVAANLTCGRPGEDGLALIALRDPARSDTGNILLGDPNGSSLSEVDAFLLAENDIRVPGTGTRGSRALSVRGCLAAGNQIRLAPPLAADRWRLCVDHDDRFLSGQLTLPGLSAQIGRATTFTVLSWKQDGGS